MINKEKYTFVYVPPPWRNGLACWTSNSKVVGSSPTGGGFLFFYLFFIYFSDRLSFCSMNEWWILLVYPWNLLATLQLVFRGKFKENF